MEKHTQRENENDTETTDSGANRSGNFERGGCGGILPTSSATMGNQLPGVAPGITFEGVSSGQVNKAHTGAPMAGDSGNLGDSVGGRDLDAVSSEQESNAKVSARLSAPSYASGFSSAPAPQSDGMRPSEQAKSMQSQDIAPLPSEQSESNQEQAAWLKSLLPLLDKGWWDVAANGKGFVIKQRWRDNGQQTQTYPRVSREQFEALKGMDNERAKITIADTIFGHLDDCLKIASKRERARCAAARLGIAD